MDMQIGFFDDVARVGGIILQILGGSDDNQKVLAYLEKVEDIYKLLIQIHDEIVDVIIRSRYANTLKDIRENLKGIEHESLEKVFKAHKWCGEMKQLGIALQPLSIDANLIGTDKLNWDKFCQNLEQHEGAVAMLYHDNLFNIRILSNQEMDIEILKQRLDEIADMLVIQKAKFDSLAKRAQSMRNRLIRN
jgi:hypothetical protein